MSVCSIWLALLHLVKVPCNRRPDTFGKGHCSYCDYEASHWRTRKFWIPRVVVEPNVLRICPWCWLTWIEVGIYGDFSKCHSAFSSYASPRGILPRRILWGSTTDCSHSDTPTTSFNVAVETFAIWWGNTHVMTLISYAPLDLALWISGFKAWTILYIPVAKTAVISLATQTRTTVSHARFCCPLYF